MIQTSNEFNNKIKKFFKEIRNFLGFLMLLCVAVSIIYILYWVAIGSDDSFSVHTEKIFLPLAQLLNPGDDSYDIYKSTSLYVLIAIFPLWLLCLVCDFIECVLIDSHNNAMEWKEQKEAKQAIKNNLKQYDEIQNYSICVSLDYISDKNISDSSRETLEKNIFQKIKELNPKLNFTIGKTLIFKSSNFDKYDSTFEAIIKTLAKINGQIYKKYNIRISPTITVDAYNKKQADIIEIEKNHENIKKLNFHNKAATSGLFLKKYKFLQKNKYGGTPVGEYNSVQDTRTKTYELNVIYRNLAQTLINYEVDE